jgi:hypothetical protein
MGQSEILDYLRMLRELGDHSFYSKAEINKKVGNESTKATCQKINKLYAYGYLEVKIRNYRLYYRGKIDGME